MLSILFKRTGKNMVSLRSLTPSLTRITIASAVGAALHMGQGNVELVDRKAVEFSRAVLSQMEIDGEIISCEGPIDNAPAFELREKVGLGTGPRLEFVMDPVDGTTATAMGGKDAISALACAPSGCLQALPDDGYYFKIAAGPEAMGRIDLNSPVESIIKEVASSKSLMVISQDQSRPACPRRVSTSLSGQEKAPKRLSQPLHSSVSEGQCLSMSGVERSTMRKDLNA